MKIKLPSRAVDVSEDDYAFLWPLVPPYCERRNALKGQWDKMEPEEYHHRSKLYLLGLIDAYGNVTVDGALVIELINEAERAEGQHLFDLLEMQELDDLEAQCRKRPQYNRYDG